MIELPPQSKPIRQRTVFESNWQFSITYWAFIIGLGDIWKFPWLMNKYGGLVFLVPYGIAFLFFAIPMMLQEVTMGQKFQRSFIRAYSGIHPRLAGVGVGNIVLGILFIGYYNLLLTYNLIYLGYAITSETLPWTTHQSNIEPCSEFDSASLFFY